MNNEMNRLLQPSFLEVTLLLHHNVTPHDINDLQDDSWSTFCYQASTLGHDSLHFPDAFWKIPQIMSLNLSFSFQGFKILLYSIVLVQDISQQVILSNT